jgi:RNA polymerase sigma factor (sigma-70 family)
MAAAPPDDVLGQFDTLFQLGTLGEATDGQLLERFVAGPGPASASAFAALVGRHGGMVLRACRRILADPNDAEDAAQAAFLVLARRARAIRRRDSVGSWLFGVAYRIARRARVDAARRRKHERRGAEMAARRIDAPGPDESGRGPELIEELGRLPEAMRAPLVLCYLEGLSREQAARQLRMTLRTFDRRLSQGRERLRARLIHRGLAPAAFVAWMSRAAESARVAEIPAAWAVATVRAAARVAGGGEVAGAGAASAEAWRWSEEASRAMIRTKVRVAATSILLAVALAAGLFPLARGQRAPEPGAETEPPAKTEPPQVEPPRVSARDLAGGRRSPGLAQAFPTTGPGRVFHLRVVSDDTGKPVPSADVRIWIAMTDDWRTTDAEGRLDIVHSTGPADTQFGVDVWGDGFAMQRHWWGGEPDSEIPDGATIRLGPGESLSGVVKDEEGRPIEGATVYLWSHNYKKRGLYDAGGSHEILYDLRATTGPDGRWQTRGAPETTGELMGFSIIHPDYISDPEDVSRERPPIADLRVGKAVSVLKRGVPIEGRVLDSDGAPVSDALVILTNRPYSLFTQVKRSAVSTDADGRYRTGPVAPGQYHIVVRAEGRAPGAEVVEVGHEAPQVDVHLGRSRPLKIRVADSEGEPISGAFVSVDTWRVYRCLGVFFWTDAEGRICWDDAPDDPLIVNISHSDYLGLSRLQVKPSGEEIAFTLRPSMSIIGTVSDAETGRNVKQAEVEVGAVDPETGEVKQWIRPQGAYLTVHDGALNASFAPEGADAYKIRITAPGYAPFVSRAFKPAERTVRDYAVKLDPPEPGGNVGTLFAPDGGPLPGAEMHLSRVQDGFDIDNGVIRSRTGGGPEVVTERDGSFPIPRMDAPYLVLLASDAGWAYATRGDLAKSPRVQARRYGRVEGQFLIGGRPGANVPVRLAGRIQDASTDGASIVYSQGAITDADGRFTFEKVVPTDDLRVSREDLSGTPGWVRSSGAAVRVEPGETARVTVGGRGQPVVGRLEPPEGWPRPVDYTDRGEVMIERDRPEFPVPMRFYRGRTSPPVIELERWFDEWKKGPEGRAYDDGIVRIRVGLQPDGSFRVDDVPAGEYRLVARVGEDERGREPGPFARLSRAFTIPPIPGGRSDEPLDLGAIRFRRRIALKVGDPAPSFKVATVEGKTLSVPGDYEGRVLLLDFGSLWDRGSRSQVVRLNALHAKFGSDDRFAILSLVLANDDAESREFVSEKGEPWPQAIVGPLDNPIATAYGVEDRDLPAAILIGPDGKVAFRGSLNDPAEVEKAVAEGLGRK